MSESPRRYSEEEVEKILELAAEAQVSGGQLGLPSRAGMTLAEVQEIASEAGISTALVARAATEIDRPRGSSASAEVYLGTPLDTERIVELPRNLTQEEWERLVLDLRDTFDAPGEISGDGNLKQWRHGRVEALLEPTGSGFRFRLRARRHEAKESLAFGVGFGLATPALGTAMALAGGELGLTLGLTALMGASAAGAYFGTKRSVGRWLAETELAIEGIVGRLIASLEETPELPAG